MNTMNNDTMGPQMDGVPPMDGMPPPMDGSTPPPTNALSIYGQDPAVEDFPVLKAFQQYIDAEQSKSRKRMIMLSMFFGGLMTVLVAVFMYMLQQSTAKNQALNDRLIEYVMKDRDRQPVVVQPAATPLPANTANDAALKAMTDTLVALQKQMADQQQARPAPAAAPAAAEPVKTAAQSEAERELDRLNKERVEKLKKANALLQAERKKLEAEKARLREEKIEAYRRKHYPELYRSESPSPSPSVQTRPVEKPVTTIKMTQPKPKAAVKESEKKDTKKTEPKHDTKGVTEDDEPIEYFSEDGDEYSISVKDDAGNAAQFTIPTE